MNLFTSTRGGVYVIGQAVRMSWDDEEDQDSLSSVDVEFTNLNCAASELWLVALTPSRSLGYYHVRTLVYIW